MRRGLTLVEVLVSCAILGLLSGLLITIWMACRPAVEKTESHIAAQEQVREPVRRLARLLDTAIAPAGGSAIESPPAGTRSTQLQFYSCDLLDGSQGTVDPRNPRFYLYRVRTVGDQLVLERLDDAGDNSLGRVVLGRSLTTQFTPLQGAVRVEASAQDGVRTSLTTILALPRGN